MCARTAGLLRNIFIVVLVQVALAQSPAQSGSSEAQSSAPSPTQPAASQQVPTLKVTTRLVAIDVVAADHKGVPLKDLKADDFVLEEESHPQKVRVFSFQDASQTQAAAAAASEPPGPISNVPQFKNTGPLNVILVDGLNTNPKNLIYVKDEMLRMLEKLPTGQPVAIYALGSRLRLLQDFTTDSTLLKQAMHSLKSKSAPAVDATSVQSEPFLSAGIAGALNEMGMDAMVQQIQAFEQDNATYQTDFRVELTLAALKSLARNLSGYPGRKNLIWVSEVFPTYIFPQANESGSGGSNLARQALYTQKDYGAELQQVADALANSHIAVYPVDARTVGNTDSYASLSNTDSRGNYLGRSATGRGAGGRSLTANEINLSVNDSLDSHGTMNSIADETGGRAFYNNNDLNGVIRESIRDGSTYYTLGYYPDNKNWDGKFRRITVKVNRPGVKLRFRHGYYASDPEGYPRLNQKQRAEDFGRSLSLEMPVSTALPFQAAVVPASGQDSKSKINYGIDAHALTFELTEDGMQHASVDCAVEVYSKKREAVRVQGNTFNATLKPAQYQMVMQKFFPCSQMLDLPAGDYVLRLGVRDNHTGLIGTANTTLSVPAPPVASGNPATQDKKP